MSVCEYCKLHNLHFCEWSYMHKTMYGQCMGRHYGGLYDSQCSSLLPDSHSQ